MRFPLNIVPSHRDLDPIKYMIPSAHPSHNPTVFEQLTAEYSYTLQLAAPSPQNLDPI